MTATRKRRWLVVAVAVAAAVTLAAVLVSRPRVEILHLGTVSWGGEPRDLFILTNHSSRKLSFNPSITNGIERLSEDGWTRAHYSLTWGPLELEPHAGWRFVGPSRTNTVPWRQAIAWGVPVEDVRARPDWLKRVDSWLEGRRLPSVGMPHGIVRGPVMQPNQTNQVPPPRLDIRPVR